jgi:hypothetical protein
MTLIDKHRSGGSGTEHEWLKLSWEGEISGNEVFAYLEFNGITREDAVTPRKDREESGEDEQQLVLAFFDTEDAADQAANALKDWEKATKYMKVDGIGVLVKVDKGWVKEHEQHEPGMSSSETHQTSSRSHRPESGRAVRRGRTRP